MVSAGKYRFVLTECQHANDSIAQTALGILETLMLQTCVNLRIAPSGTKNKIMLAKSANFVYSWMGADPDRERGDPENRTGLAMKR